MPKPELEIIVEKTYRVKGLMMLKAREAAELSQEALAERMGRIKGWQHQQNVHNKEIIGMLHAIDEEALEKLAEIFDLHFI